jgi:hypothetical protein
MSGNDRCILSRITGESPQDIFTLSGNASYKKKWSGGLRSGERVVKIANTVWRIWGFPHIAWRWATFQGSRMGQHLARQQQMHPFVPEATMLMGTAFSIPTFEIAQLAPRLVETKISVGFVDCP